MKINDYDIFCLLLEHAKAENREHEARLAENKAWDELVIGLDGIYNQGTLAYKTN